MGYSLTGIIFSMEFIEQKRDEDNNLFNMYDMQYTKMPNDISLLAFSKKKDLYKHFGLKPNKNDLKCGILKI